MRVSLAAVVSLFIGFTPMSGAAQQSSSQAGLTGLPRLENTQPGNPARGRQIVRDVNNATCLICHAMPIPEEPDHGEIGPPLHGVGSRYTVEELRLRLVDPKAINPDTIMPSYFRAEGFTRVSEAFRGRPIYTAQQIEDVVAYLATLTEEPSD